MGMFGAAFGSIVTVLKIIFLAEGDLLSRILALPPVLIDITGGVLKPILMIGDPFIRLLRFIITGDYDSINAGQEIAASFGYNTWNQSFRGPKTPKNPSAPQSPNSPNVPPIPFSTNGFEGEDSEDNEDSSGILYRNKCNLHESPPQLSIPHKELTLKFKNA